MKVSLEKSSLFIRLIDQLEYRSSFAAKSRKYYLLDLSANIAVFVHFACKNLVKRYYKIITDAGWMISGILYTCIATV